MSNAAPVILVGENGGGATVTGGKLDVNATFGGVVQTGAEATAAAPTYTEGQDAPLSQNLTGDLRVIAKTSMGTTLTSVPVTVPATANGIQMLAANLNRKSANIYNPGSVNVYFAQTNAVTTSSGYIPPGQSLNINDYTGAIFGIVAASTQSVSVMEVSA